MGKLSDCLSRKQVDSWCLDFCNLNNKRSRRRLVKEMFTVKLNRLELLPYYGRIVATLSRVYLDIGPELADKLEMQLRRLIRTKDINRTESRLRNIRFLAELVKFKVEGAPPEKVFRIFAFCFKNFDNITAPCVCALFESAGRYLYRTKDTFSRTNHYLEMLMQKKKERRWPSHLLTDMDNAFYHCAPPDDGEGGSAKYHPRKERSPLEAYVYHLIVDNLGRCDGSTPRSPFRGKRFQARIRYSARRFNPRSMQIKAGYSQTENLHNEQVLLTISKLKKLPWSTLSSQDAYYRLVTKCMLRVCRVRSCAIPLCCDVIVGLKNAAPQLKARIADRVIEEIEFGLKTNKRVHKQRRMAHARFLAQLYLVGIIHTDTIIDLLYMLLHYGHARMWPEHVSSYNKESIDSMQSSHTELRARRPLGPNLCYYGERDAHCSTHSLLT